jgi:hypothetical protein
MWCGPHRVIHTINHSIRYDRVNLTGEMKNVGRSCLRVHFMVWNLGRTNNSKETMRKT